MYVTVTVHILGHEEAVEDHLSGYKLDGLVAVRVHRPVHHDIKYANMSETTKGKYIFSLLVKHLVVIDQSQDALSAHPPWSSIGITVSNLRVDTSVRGVRDGFSEPP